MCSSVRGHAVGDALLPRVGYTQVDPARGRQNPLAETESRAAVLPLEAIRSEALGLAARQVLPARAQLVLGALQQPRAVSVVGVDRQPIPRSPTCRPH